METNPIIGSPETSAFLVLNNTEQQPGAEQVRLVAQQDMERLQMQILHNFRHELHVPLAEILMPLEMVVKNRFWEPADQSRFINEALSSDEQLESLVTDFILLTEIDQGGMDIVRQPIDPELHILAPVRKRLERYAEKSLELHTEVELTSKISAPRREFTHAIVHLADNAFKFSPRGGSVWLTVRSIPGGTTISIQDQGAGLPAELREKVFERYYRASRGDSGAQEGLGVGLTVARAVLRSLGGDVTMPDSPSGCLVEAFLPNPPLGHAR